MAEEDANRFSRREILLGGAAAGIGSLAALGADAVLHPSADAAETTSDAAETATLFGSETVPFYGEHQAGVETPPQAHADFLGFTLHDDVDADALARLMRVLTDDAARMTQGAAPLADPERELDATPSRLTVTFGFGPGFVDRVAPAQRPSWLAPLPSYSIDRLDAAWTGGDLLVQICADDPLTVAHAARMTVRDVRSTADLAWAQIGFRRARGTEPSGTTARNLMGQVDGTVNPVAGTDDFASVVWIEDGTWMSGGTSIVLRRIAMQLDTWDQVDRSGRENTIGRTLDTGAPLTGGTEHTDPDYEATDALGFPVISTYAHMRRAHGDAGAERIFRRPYSYDLHPTDGGDSDSGLIFVTYQRDVVAQYEPIQARLAAGDLLNQWTVPIGSAVFAIPPGCDEGGFVGETLWG